ncbi:ABC transporter substrate-binding protein [Geomonas terrae]|uniref:ABC transporter substrate-binding protein n=1 Tax=Geomonas terrae TaxID=2562681 RepID=A0A4S1CI08_9BACT|nr:ABC transporter substrate binding protein [Geomonas terrae]TGU72766.1 ABC transporter substrate-binding protein [Geomonas terrae]
MQVLRFLLFLLLLLSPLPAFAYDVLILQSMHEKGYAEAVRGFKKECRASSRMIVLSDYADLDLVRIVREEHPKVIVAVGDRALELAQKQGDTPVLCMMALNVKPRRWVSGISMLFDPARYLSLFQSLGTDRVGVLYDPGRSGVYVKKALAASKGHLRLVLREVHAPKETPAMLQSLRGKVDALWMIPDVTAVSAASTEAYFLFSQSERVPVVSFADVYLTMGAAVALTIDRYDIGRQLGEMAQDLLEGRDPEEGMVPPRKVLSRTNDGVVRQLKLSGLGGH